MPPELVYAASAWANADGGRLLRRVRQADFYMPAWQPIGVQMVDEGAGQGGVASGGQLAHAVSDMFFSPSR